MQALQKLLLLILLSLPEPMPAAPPARKLPLDPKPTPMRFEHMTEVRLGMGDAHIVVHIPLVVLALQVNKTLETVRAFQHLQKSPEDWVNMVYQAQQTNYEILSIIVSLGLFDTFVEQYKTGALQAWHKQHANRQERQALALLAGAAIIGNTIFSYYNSQRLNAIEEASRTNAKAIGTLAHAIGELDTAVGRNAKAIDTIASKVDRNDHYNTLRFRLLALVTTTAQVVSRTAQIVSAVQSGKTHPTLLTNERLYQAFSAISRQAQEAHLSPITTNPTDILQFKCSFGTSATGNLVLFIHVPLYSERFPMDAYRFSAIPIQTKAGFFDLTVNERILITGPHPSEFFTLSKLEFQQCQTFANFSYCPMPDTLSSPTSKVQGPNMDRCLYALRQNFIDDITKFCESRPIEAQQLALRTGKQTYTLFSDSSRPLTYSCPDQDDLTSSYKGISSITLEPGCSISSEAFAVHTPVMVPTEDKSLHFTILELPDPIQTFSELSNLTLEMAKTEDHTLEMLFKREHSFLNKVSSLDQVSSSFSSGHPTAIFTIVLICILIALIAAIVLYCYCIRKKAQTPAPAAQFVPATNNITLMPPAPAPTSMLPAITSSAISAVGPDPLLSYARSLMQP